MAAYAAWFPAGTVFLCVVDPGVGGARPAIILEADGKWYVGPGNGLFELVQRRAERTHSFDITWHPERLSASLVELAQVLPSHCLGQEIDRTHPLPAPEEFPRYPDGR